MTPQLRERLILLAEETAEVGQAVSKLYRFGAENFHPNLGAGTNREKIERELGDVYAVYDLLVAGKFVTRLRVKTEETHHSFAPNVEYSSLGEAAMDLGARCWQLVFFEDATVPYYELSALTHIVNRLVKSRHLTRANIEKARVAKHVKVRKYLQFP